MDQIHGSRIGGKNNSNPVIALTVEIGGELKTIRGRDAWALGELISGGLIGVTPIERPAPRWSHYVHKLRRVGINVETIDEKHSGAFSGTHARYVLRSSLRVVETIHAFDHFGQRRDRGGFKKLPVPEGIWR